jgi:hypothetical protein
MNFLPLNPYGVTTMSLLSTRLARLEERVNVSTGPGRIQWVQSVSQDVDSDYIAAAIAAIEEAVSPPILAFAGPGEMLAMLGVWDDGTGQVECAARTWRFQLTPPGLGAVEATIIDDHIQEWNASAWERVRS